MRSTPNEGAAERVVVAGASGFIGNALGPRIGDRFELVGLSRSRRNAGNGYARFEPADLFSLRDATRALTGASRAIYLVHSMLPSARLMQGHFGDMDLLCADNFARAAAANGVREIIYVGGLVGSSPELSDHLRSRLEVEKALSATGVTVRTLRAGIIVGASGSSYQVVRRLASRLPVMLCPSWTGTRMQPVALDDVVAAIDYMLKTAAVKSSSSDLGAPAPITYRELMAATAESLGLRRVLIPVPFLTPRLSALWVTMTTGAPKALIAPLVESLTHEMVVREDQRLEIPGRPPTSVTTMLEQAAREDEASTSTKKRSNSGPHAFERRAEIRDQSEARSVERMCLPRGANAAWAAREYLRWLPVALKGLIGVSEGRNPGEVEFRTPGVPSPLLVLRYAADRSTSDRQMFVVGGGFLSRRPGHGRLEFRQLANSRTLLASVHEFEPRLPWWIYRNSQAIFHVMVMRRFAQHLENCDAVDSVDHLEAAPLIAP